MARPLTVIGLMSGTSLDGVDAAVLRTDGVQVQEHGPSLSLSYEPALRQRARALLDRAASLSGDDPELRAIERAITLRHVEAVQSLRKQVGAVDLIGFHGQTIHHAPARHRTWQIGDAALLSHETNLPVVHDFRTADVEAGGEGAPLAPWYHAALLHDARRPVAVLNIGGVANVTFIGQDGQIVACDTGPGNALLDDWAFRHTGMACDLNGALARAGVVNRAVLEQLMAAPYFSRPAPKSLDRLTFIKALEAVSGCSAPDGAATLTAFTVAAIACTRLPEKPATWFVCGGGRHNPALMEGLRLTLEAPVETVENLGWNGDALEAECFAFLAVRALKALPLSAPGITGAPDFRSGGRLTCAGLSPIPTWIRPGGLDA
ncbi:anhydro-N-acetylmuramic acid kinase [Acetobacter conturbans]|uniref:Anhydro-N-acetylmuramic acid kinase n=1 Tax=Acetobacter conturbans TaxID=1737472 RepID=A0ABX0JZZ1_9PROT|nr:anhydro-N-acetylmuramic acid kinase [Acetobacter conturbans]NHN88979.1 anhydro-N-acetylmuramic acid kinase [Acetobacter conturbans]